MWAIKGSKPKVKSYPGKDNISYSGFVIPSTGKLFTCKPEWFNYETTISSIRAFLKSNPLSENHKYYLIMDNAPWHKKAKRLIKENSNQEYSDITNKIVFVYLPPYSPDLNPIEQVWRMTRRDATHNIFFNDVHELEQRERSLNFRFTLTLRSRASLQRAGASVTVLSRLSAESLRKTAILPDFTAPHTT